MCTHSLISHSLLKKMSSLNVRKSLMILIVLGILAIYVRAQNCGCAPNLCCSQYGYCGLGNAYCGQGCRSGPCTQTPSPGGGGSVANIVTPQFFNGILNKATGNCPGKSFFTRQAFLDAVKSYSEFGSGSADASKREIAAFFAHVTLETGHFCNIEEINKAVYCDTSPRYRQYPCNPSKRYYGRGPLQLTWNYNYALAGRSNNFDGLNSPETVATNSVVSFKTALWFWRENVRSVLSQGFGATINKINGDVECGGKQRATVAARIGYYRDYCSQFGVDPGNNLSC